jgi:hypothetical protein
VSAINARRNLLWILLALVSLVAAPAPVHAAPAGAVCDGQWFVTPTPNPGTARNELFAVDVAPNGEAWAVGYQSEGGPSRRPLILHWEGGAWAQIPSPVPGSGVLNDVTVISQDDAWIVGTMGGDDPVILHWNGTAWLPTPDPSLVAGQLLAVSAGGPSDVWAAGDNWVFANPALVEHWDGSAWTIVPAPPSPHYLTSVEARGPFDAWVAGEVMNEDTDASAHWNGTTWEVFPFEGFVNEDEQTRIEALESTPDGTIWAAGRHYPVEPYTPTMAVIERWTGTAWQAEFLPDPGAGVRNSSLYDIAWTGDGLWAVGSEKASSDSLRETLTMRRTLHGWSIVSSPSAGTTDNLFGVAGRRGTTFTVGSYLSRTGFKTFALHRCRS